MTEDRNQNQIIRIDARGCFVESLSDSFEIGKAHFVFATYDLSKPSGQRQTNNIHIYIDVAELLELCRKLLGGEMRWLMQNKKKNGDNTPLSMLRWHLSRKAGKIRPQQSGWNESIQNSSACVRQQNGLPFRR